MTALAAAPTALGGQSDAATLAQRYSPVVRIVADTGDCTPLEPYVPINVNLLFDEPTVALRGPWGGGDLVAIGPGAKELGKGLYEYHLDFPGDALAPGCSYLHWQARLIAGHKPVVYAHVATEAGYPGKLSLQYWFFYVFNDWNNLHEGDWEMIQLVFDADSPAQALHRSPTEIGYSQHEGAERAAWTDSKLEIVDGTHPVVHPAAGSHANFYGSALYLGASASEGVGCDDTRGATFDVDPTVETIPSDPTQARAAFPWINFQGRWGELRPAFFNGPTGPNMKEQWTEPISWSQTWRNNSSAVPGSSAFGPAATGFFCGAIGRGSVALVQLVNRPLEVALLLIALALVAALVVIRATWRPSAPLRLAARRAWGQVLAATARMYLGRLSLFVAIGLALVPITLVVTVLQEALLHATGVVGVETGGTNTGILSLLVVAAGTALTLLGLGLVQAATARALIEIDAGRPVDAVRAYRLASEAARPLFGSLLLAAVVISLLFSSIYGIPIALWLGGRWALVAPVVELEGAGAFAALRRSGRLVHGRWLKVSSLIVVGAALVLVIGPLIGVLLILLTDTPFWLVNVVAGVVYAVTMPIVALATAYTYFDARVQGEIDRDDDDVVPAEIELAT